MIESNSAAPSPFHSHVFLGEGHEKSERRTWAVIWLCGAMMIAEIVGGLLFGSIALVADGLHRRLLSDCRQPPPDSGAGALQRACHCRRGGIQLDRDLRGGESEYLAQEEHGPRHGRQQLERDHERELDALPVLIPRLR